jgi:hypothetical protein
MSYSKSKTQIPDFATAMFRKTYLLDGRAIPCENPEIECLKIDETKDNSLKPFAADFINKLVCRVIFTGLRVSFLVTKQCESVEFFL